MCGYLRLWRQGEADPPSAAKDDKVFRGRLLLAAVVVLPLVVVAQQPMGTVATRDARVTGGLEVEGERAKLLTNVSVTAYARTAQVTLDRGGEVLVCATSEFHLLHSGTGKGLLFGLDRGAVEIRSASEAQDVLLTPDIRFSVEAPGAMDLRLRVTREGDTCVDNAGAKAPVLLLSDAFSSAAYRVLPGQHVLFEKGNLREVVDHEREPCGCPPDVPVQMAGAVGGHPFPTAVSEGLAAPALPANAAPAGEPHMQVSASLSYGEGAAPPPPVTAPAAVGSTSGVASGSGSGPATPPETPPGAHDIASAIGRFFHKLFHGKK